MPALILFYLFRDGGPRADDGHVADKDVPKLGQLVDGELAEPFADGGEAGVVTDLEDERAFVAALQLLLEGFGVGDHGTELVDTEAATVEAATNLAEDNRAGGGEADGESDQGEEGGQDDEGQRGENDVGKAFQE